LGNTADWVIGLCTTVIGALLAQFLANRQAYSEVRQRADLKGTWMSLSETGETREPVRDTVEISIKGGKFLIRNKEKKEGFDYEAHCSLFDQSMLVGPWKSDRPGATAKGHLMLQVASQGSYLYGVYSGIHSDGHHMLLGWVMARNEDCLQAGVKALKAGTSTSFEA
jgi:hypothetical protein